jgi:hypothetical protein
VVGFRPLTQQSAFSFEKRPEIMHNYHYQTDDSIYQIMELTKLMFDRLIFLVKGKRIKNAKVSSIHGGFITDGLY